MFSLPFAPFAWIPSANENVSESHVLCTLRTRSVQYFESVEEEFHTFRTDLRRRLVLIASRISGSSRAGYTPEILQVSPSVYRRPMVFWQQRTPHVFGTVRSPCAFKPKTTLSEPCRYDLASRAWCTFFLNIALWCIGIIKYFRYNFWRPLKICARTTGPLGPPRDTALHATTSGRVSKTNVSSHINSTKSTKPYRRLRTAAIRTYRRQVW